MYELILGFLLCLCISLDFNLWINLALEPLDSYYMTLTNCFCSQCKREGYIQRVKDEEGEGCNIHGSLEVNKVAGNFHFATGKSLYQSSIFLADLLAFQDNHNVRFSWITNIFYLDLKISNYRIFELSMLFVCNFTTWCMVQISHRVNKLSFGDHYPGLVNPLDG